MQRVDGPTRAAALPAPGATGTGASAPGYFTAGDPIGGVPPTTVPAWFLNMVQEELAGVVEHTGAALDKANHGQLLAAILAIAGGSLDLDHGTLTFAGLILKWGTTAIGSGSNVVSGPVTFATAFPTACFGVYGNADGAANGQWHPIVVTFDPPTAAGTTFTADSANANQAIAPGRSVRWLALGH